MVIADDHPVVLAGLRDLLDRSGEFVVVASCRDGAGALAAVRTHKPSIVVLDLRMPVMTGLDVARALSFEPQRPGIVLLTAALEGSEIERASALEVDRILLKESAAELLVETLSDVCRRRSGGGRPDRHIGSRSLILSRLHPAEREIALLISRDFNPSEIAGEISDTPDRVYEAIEGLGRECGVSDPHALRDCLRAEFGGSWRRTADERAAPEHERLMRRFRFTPREAAVAVLLQEGFTNREIAERLGITVNTVKTHIGNIHAKTDVTSTRRLLVVLRQESGGGS